MCADRQTRQDSHPEQRMMCRGVTVKASCNMEIFTKVCSGGSFHTNSIMKSPQEHVFIKKLLICQEAYLY